jgi:hypothetical protein
MDNTSENYEAMSATASEADGSESKATEKRRPGRPKKEDAVKRVNHRLTVYINNDLYEYWTERNQRSNGNMAALINRLLYEEMERYERTGNI